MFAALARFREEVADGTVLGPVRAGIGALLAFHALRAAEELAKHGYFGDVFHLPIVPEAWVASRSAYALIVASQLCFAVMVTVGIWARVALAASALLGTYCLLCDRLAFDHDRYALYCYALLLSLSPCDRSWRATDSVGLEPRLGPFWAVRLAQLQVSLLYLASGGAKLLDADWRDGVVLADRFAHHGPSLFERLGAVVARPHVSSAAAKIAIMSELVLCAAVWMKRARVVAFWWGLWFHAFVLLASEVETFTLATVVMYGAFVTPDYRPRRLRFDPSRGAGRLAGAVVPLLDWFARFEVKPWEPDALSGHSIVVVRRDGSRVTGIRAFALLARCLPVLFPLWAPAALLASFTRGGDLSTGG